MHLFSSNKVVPPSLLIPKPVQYLAKILQFISHKLVVLFATKLFTTPFTFSTPKREIAMEESSQNKKLFVNSIKKEIHVLSYGFSDKKVLLSHGWAGRSTQLFMIANKLLEKGFMVISFDAPAHGKSLGRTTNMIEYIETIKAINNEFGPFEAAIGHSFGAMALLNASAEKELFKCLVTVGSGDKVSDIISNYIKNLGLKEPISKKMKAHFEKKLSRSLEDFTTSEAAKKVKTPTLVIHDLIDGDVAVSCALNIRQSLQNGSLLITNGLGHTKILRDKDVTNKIINFILINT
ncbi:alpha/beta hydrolase [Polaribacter sp. SA4-10]|uniref:alpha/beta hydrolase family protein n=1 Tax=Polaribacter sp. SA4-10 TaxID=754397 RepID=UPI000B3D04ED|nr:alpha/beta hydrolase [Polaribacter sp. SA4-10]ARV05616.1 alpha/beta hydrolase [Polaribacter sp. SA4-10]